MRFLSILLVLLFAVSAAADDILVTGQPAGDSCTIWTLCDDRTVTGVCQTPRTGMAAANSILRAANQKTWSCWADSSDETTGPWQIKIYDRTSGGGYSATMRTLLNSNGDITVDDLKFQFYGLQGDMHATVAGTPGAGVTLVCKGCTN